MNLKGRQRKLAALFSYRAVLLALAAATLRCGPSGPVAIQLLAINDFHGYLEAAPGASGLVNGTPAGGVEYLAAHLQRAAAANPHTIVVGAGDLVGASPLLSSLFEDQPTLEAMRALHMDVSSVGNHEFDKGADDLLRRQTTAGFQYLAANVVRGDPAGRATILPATAIRTIGGVRIGFIGETLEGTPQIVAAGGIKGLTFQDEASTANAYAAGLVQQGVKAIVLLIHQGGRQTKDDQGDPNGCADFHGGILPVLDHLSPAIKVVISGHTHQAYNCAIGGRLVTSAASYGRMFTRVNLTVNRATGEIEGMSATNEVVTRDGPKDPGATSILTRYSALAAPLADKVVGSATADLSRKQNDAGEDALGDVIADAQLEAARAVDKRAAVAFMNQGGIRSDVAFAHIAGGEKPGEATYGELFTVQPFGNNLVVVTMTGDAIHRVLEQQFHEGTRTPTFLQISNGLSYTYRRDAAPGFHVRTESIRVNGSPLATADRVRVAASDFLLGGGDGFTVFGEATEPTGVGPDIDALVAHFRTHSPVEPGPQNRIVRTP